MPIDLILASGSPRRIKMLKELGIKFISTPTNVEEIPLPNEAPEKFARRLAIEKAEEIAKKQKEKTWVLGADTIVVLDGKIIGKPKTKRQAKQMLRALSGRWHEVQTAFCLLKKESKDRYVKLVKSSVKFIPLTNKQINWYVNTGESMDKAGSYAVQGIGAFIVESIKGSYTNVIGLPMSELVCALNKLGVINFK